MTTATALKKCGEHDVKLSSDGVCVRCRIDTGDESSGGSGALWIVGFIIGMFLPIPNPWE